MDVTLRHGSGSRRVNPRRVARQRLGGITKMGQRDIRRLLSLGSDGGHLECHPAEGVTDPWLGRMLAKSEEGGCGGSGQQDGTHHLGHDGEGGELQGTGNDKGRCACSVGLRVRSVERRRVGEIRSAEKTSLEIVRLAAWADGHGPRRFQLKSASRTSDKVGANGRQDGIGKTSRPRRAIEPVVSIWIRSHEHHTGPRRDRSAASRGPHFRLVT